MSFLRRLVCLAVVLSLTISQSQRLVAEDPKLVLPDDARLEGILSPAEFFGFEIGARHLRHAQVVDYWRYLGEHSERVTLIEYGHTHGARPLTLLAITSDANTTNLARLRKARPRLTSGNFNGKIEQQKLVMYMGYSVHGDESSAVNAAPLVAYHLASSLSEQALDWLEDSVFLIDPAINPDGIDRFANWANENRGRYASAASIDREHNQPWPGGRTNYYWFDLNRDWLPLVHPESQGRLKLFHQWKPNVVLDFHEMSGSSSFFFQPGIPERNNPFSPARNLELTRKFAAEHTKAMDSAGELFFTEERFDDFYVGKGSTYPDLHGAVGILFEQGSTRGLRLKNDRTDRHFRDTVANQVRTSLSSIRVATASREELLEFQTDFYDKSASRAAAQEVRAYVLTGTPSRIRAAAELMLQHDIQVLAPANAIELHEADYSPDQVLVVPTSQPESTFVRSLMEPLQSFRENVFYDVSTWHLPSAFDLATHEFDDEIPNEWNTVAWNSKSALVPDSEAASSENAVGYVFTPTELGAPALVAKLQQAGAHLRVTTKEFTAGEGNTRWPIGSFLLLRQPNQEKWKAIVRTLKKGSKSCGVPATALLTGVTPVGPDLGSGTTLALPKCNPLLVVGAGTRSYSAGAIWHFMDVRLGQPTTMIESNRISNVELDGFTCIILPEGSYSDVSPGGIEALKTFARNGGTLIAVGSAINWLNRQQITSASDDGASDSAAKKVEDATPASRLFGNARTERALESIAGAFLEAEIDPTHPLAYGFPDQLVPCFRDHSTRFPVPANSYKLAAKYTQVLAGYVSQRNREKLAGSAAVWIEPVGRGRAILLADNPVFRGYVRAAERFFTNALLLGPTINIPSAPISEEESH